MSTPPKPTAPGGGPLRTRPPPPKASPTPPEPGDEDSGLYPVVKADLRKASKGTRWLVGGTAGVFAVLELLLNPKALDLGTKWAGRGDRLEAVEKKVSGLEESQHETRLDIRDLYKAMVFKQPQPRLEAPPPLLPKDGGP